MPKRQIIDLPGEPHFVTFSTYQRRQFLAPDRVKEIVLEVLQECLTRHSVLCHGFVIMPNHVHAVLTMKSELPLSKFLLAWKKTSSYRIKRFFAQELVHYHKLCPKDCPIWQSGCYDHNLEGDRKVNEKIEYMHNNPVEAGLAATAVDWKWSSARFYEKGGQVDVQVTHCI